MTHIFAALFAPTPSAASPSRSHPMPSSRLLQFSEPVATYEYPNPRCQWMRISEATALRQVAHLNCLTEFRYHRPGFVAPPFRPSKLYGFEPARSWVRNETAPGISPELPWTQLPPPQNRIWRICECQQGTRKAIKYRYKRMPIRLFLK